MIKLICVGKIKEKYLNDLIMRKELISIINFRLLRLKIVILSKKLN